MSTGRQPPQTDSTSVCLPGASTEHP